MKAHTWIRYLAAIGTVLTILALLSTAQAETVIHVKPDGSTSLPCGETWENACELQTALASAAAGDEIWAAEGTYRPGVNREDTFQLMSGVALYGGFAGTETAREERDWEATPTVLSGDIGVEGDSSDNSYHVVTAISVDAAGILDGFTIRDGNASGEGENRLGGGMYNQNSNPMINNVTFSNNIASGEWEGFGGGMNNQSSNPTLTDSIFINNSACYGGGMYNQNSNPTMSHVMFRSNQATGGFIESNGGGIFNESSNPTLTNVVFSENTADYGGGMVNIDSSPTMIEVTFRDNTAFINGGGMMNYRASIITMDHVNFIGNMAGNSGGGMYASYYCSIMLINVIFNGNVANNAGGGIYNGCNIRLLSVVFSGNMADYGGGLYNNLSSFSMFNTTISGNKANSEGGGIYSFAGSFALTNGILWGNDPTQISAFENSPDVSYSDIQGDYPGINNINQDPQFIRSPSPGVDMIWGTSDDDYGNLRLGNGSLAIDAGNNALTLLTDFPFDLDGNPRFDDIPGVPDTGAGEAPVVDMGAYEAINYAPVAVEDNFTTDQAISLTVPAPGVLTNDSDANEDPISVVLVSGPDSGLLTLNPNGSFEYRPETIDYGEITFSYHATDGRLDSNIVDVTISINQKWRNVYLPAITNGGE